MADFLVETLAAGVFYDVDLGAFDGADHVSADGGSGNEGGAHFGFAFAGDEQDTLEFHGFFGADFTVDVERVAAGDFELTAAFFDDRVHGFSGKNARGV